MNPKQPADTITIPLATAQAALDELHDLRERVKALEKENTLLSLYGWRGEQ
ncbi:hypothetical protein [Paenibacillus sp. HJGM_3]|uniref:hypothetical protein n=1 Tax=Paenibacillus sp. HJGM_3 TaxID=3379816 RepID=UPI00385D132E